MKAYELMKALFDMASDIVDPETCDTCKAGNPDVEVEKIALAMFATPMVIKQAKEWGAQLLIVHEPTYYNHFDEHSDEKIECEKRKLIEESGLTIYRYHDYPHYAVPDMIAAGELRQLDLKADMENIDGADLVRLRLDTPMTSVELAKLIETKLNIKHVRICGARDVKCTNVSLMAGWPTETFEELRREETEILLTGEIVEWQMGEYVRDAAQLGHRKALLVLGHVGSERDGMKYVKDLLADRFPELTFEYFECGEVYSYTD